MITRQTKLQLMVFGLISILGLAYTGLRYANLDRFFFDQGYIVSADFVDSGGIFKGAEVTYRGVPKGKVESLTLRPDGVRVGMLLRPGTQVPKNVKAFVGNRSAVGEQFLDLQRQLVVTEDRIQAARRLYNGNVRTYNQRVDTFPSLLVARMFHFERAHYFQLDPVTSGSLEAATSLQGARSEADVPDVSGLA